MVLSKMTFFLPHNAGNALLEVQILKVINIMATNGFEIGYHFTLMNVDQLLGNGYHFKVFRSQMATRKKS